MAAITSTGSGNWSSTVADAPWPGGVVPTLLDDVTIAAGNTVTIDAIGCEVGTMSVVGSIQSQNTVSSSLTAAGIITVQNTGTWDIDVSNDHSIKFDLVLNQAEAISAISFYTIKQSPSVTFRGFQKRRWTRLSSPVPIGSTTADVLDATGWSVGDVIALGTTTAADPSTTTETITITAIAGNAIEWVGGTTFGYLSTGYVGNMSSNLTIKSYNPAQTYSTQIKLDVSEEATGKIKLFSNVCFESLGDNSYRYSVTLYSKYEQSESFQGFLDCSFYNTWGRGVQIYAGNTQAPIERCVFYTENEHTSSTYNTHIQFEGSLVKSVIGECLFLKTAYAHVIRGASFAIAEFNRCVFVAAAFAYDSGGHMFVAAKSCSFVLTTSFPGLMLTDCDINIEFSPTFSCVADIRSVCLLEFKDCNLPLTQLLSGYWPGTLTVRGAPDPARVTVINKNKDPKIQEVYTNFSSDEPTYSRDNVLAHRSTSSLKVSPRKTLNESRPYGKLIRCVNSATITILGYVQVSASFYNSGDWIPPVVRLSGLGEVPVEFNSSNASVDAWEKYAISITNNSGIDGEFLLEFDAIAKSVLTGDIYFDGVPDTPFITKCRHYGFIMDESNPVRKVDGLAVADEATAIAYTGAVIDDDLKEITFSAGTIDTYQKLYDYTMAFVCANLDVEIPFTRAGSLFSLLPNWIVVEPTLDNTWDGGTVRWDTAGVKSGSFSSNVFDFTVVGSFDFGGASFSGTVELVNTSGGAVEVALPAGVSSTITGPDITVTIPLNYVPVTVCALDNTTKLPIENAMVLLEAGTGGDLAQGTDILKDVTDVNGILQDTAFVYTSDQPVVGVVRRGNISPYYVDVSVAGTITSAGLELNTYMSRDE